MDFRYRAAGIPSALHCWKQCRFNLISPRSVAQLTRLHCSNDHHPTSGERWCKKYPSPVLVREFVASIPRNADFAGKIISLFDKILSHNYGSIANNLHVDGQSLLGNSWIWIDASPADLFWSISLPTHLNKTTMIGTGTGRFPGFGRAFWMNSTGNLETPASSKASCTQGISQARDI